MLFFSSEIVFFPYNLLGSLNIKSQENVRNTSCLSCNLSAYQLDLALFFLSWLRGKWLPEIAFSPTWSLSHHLTGNVDTCYTVQRYWPRQMTEKVVLCFHWQDRSCSVHSLGGRIMLRSCLDSVTSVHLFCLCSVQTWFRSDLKVEEKLSTILKLIFI